MYTNAMYTNASAGQLPVQPACGQRCARFWRRQPINGAVCISCAMRLTTCRAGSTTIAFKSCAGWEPVLGPAKPDPGDRRDLAEARRDLAAWLAKWSAKYSKLTGWVEDNIDETLTFYRLPRQHHKHLKSTNMLERLNEEIKRRTHVVRIFPNGESCLRLVRALAVETHENWLEQHRYLNMDDLREHKKEALRRAA